MLFLVAASILVIFIVVYLVVMRGGLALVSKRLDEDPELIAQADGDPDGLPTDIEY